MQLHHCTRSIIYHNKPVALGSSRTAEMGSRLSYPEVDLSERVAIVTGGNSGIGYETAKGLAAMGAHTIIACRSRERAEEVNLSVVLWDKLCINVPGSNHILLTLALHSA